jgi:hypothetical protein
MYCCVKTTKRRKAMNPSIAVPHESEWEINSHGTSALHKSGLSVQLHNRGFALNIHGLESLAGTPWARKTGDLVEEGISLLGGRRVAAR